jgi:hypothetical protein
MNKTEQVMEAAASTIASLQKRVAELEARDSLGDAVQKSLQSLVQGDGGRNRRINKAINDHILQPRDVAKARKSAADRKQANRDALAVAKKGTGKVPTPSESFAKSRGSKGS